MSQQPQSIVSPRPPRPYLTEMIRIKEASSKGDPSWYSPRKNKQGVGKQQQPKSLNEFLGSPPVTPPTTKGGNYAVDKKSVVSKWQNLVKKGGSNTRGGGGGSTAMNDLHSSWSTLETAELTSHSESPLSSTSRKSLHSSYGKLRIPSDFMDACSNALLEEVDEEDSKHDGTTTTTTTTTHPSTASKKQSSGNNSRGNDSSSCSSEGSSSIHSMILAGNGSSSTSLPTGKSNKKESSSSSSSSTKNNSLQYSSDTIQVPTDLVMMTTTDGKHKVAVGRVNAATVADSPCSATSKKSRSSGSSVSTSSSSFSSSATKRKSDFRYPSMLTSIEVDDDGDDDDNRDDDVEEEDALYITTRKPIKGTTDSSIVSNNNIYRQHSNKIRSAFNSSISTLSDNSDSYYNNAATSTTTTTGATARHDHYRTIITESELVSTCQNRRGTCIMHVYDYNMEYNDLSCAIDNQLERLSAPIYDNNRSHKCEFVRVHASLLTPQLAQKLGVATSSETTFASKSPSSSSTTCIATPTILAIRNGIVEGQLSDLFPDIYTTVRQRNGGRREQDEVDEFIRDGQFVEDFVLITGCTKSDSCNLRSLLNSFRFVSITERGGGIL